ncbi:hypothetical protein K9U34_02780 [Lawsonia intracellularis]|uniref:NA n=1 Tax=Lawsonia intracellularis (strain PHE/MN1-00) TaxID=363253 RepID=Q1MQK9_LAWIP|nr:hypothetical protein [Lawsonia intracellularis]AGC50085.1 hypothetical protein LAW_00688 [Lawsonia intracellularis N343]KAA0204782.1 hypothetical protein C4K43_03740 [Lawsonia intracellularis]MBZ3892523.1 hypothetical protein [Lawsonia intracellularis]RBN33305.1 hypothetical protein DR194_02635 [Lawsonia intracellularis]RBN34870.1 hypothetical protein DR192_00605 [Lawsonia intracellularis]
MYPITSPHNTSQVTYNIPNWTINNEETKLARLQNALEQKYHIGLSLMKTCFSRTPSLIVGSIVGAGVGSLSLPLSLPSATIAGGITTVGIHAYNTLKENNNSSKQIINLITSSIVYDIVHNNNKLQKVCLEPFSQIKGDFYRTLCRFSIDETEQASNGICHGLSFLWIREMIINANDPSSMKESLQQLKTINSFPPNEPNSITIHRELYTNDGFGYFKLLPECEACTPKFHFCREKETYGTIASEDRPEKNPITFGKTLIKSLLESELSFNQKYATITLSLSCSNWLEKHSCAVSIETPPLKNEEREDIDNSSQPVIINYFDPNYGQFQLKTSISEAPQTFSEFFQYFNSIAYPFVNKNYSCEIIFKPHKNAKNRIPQNALRLTL